jgi:hypothetical protein
MRYYYPISICIMLVTTSICVYIITNWFHNDLFIGYVCDVQRIRCIENTIIAMMIIMYLSFIIDSIILSKRLARITVLMMLIRLTAVAVLSVYFLLGLFSPHTLLIK